MNILRYEPLAETHAAALAAVWADEAVIRYTNVKTPCTDAELLERVRLLMPFDVFAVWAEDALIGVIGCPPMDAARKEYGVFYQFRRDSWGQGHGCRAATWLLAHMKHRYGHLTLLAEVVSANTASEKILQKLGFSFTGEAGLFTRDGFSSPIHGYRKNI